MLCLYVAEEGARVNRSKIVSPLQIGNEKEEMR